MYSDCKSQAEYVPDQNSYELQAEGEVPDFSGAFYFIK